MSPILWSVRIPASVTWRQRRHWPDFESNFTFFDQLQKAGDCLPNKVSFC